MYVFRAYYSLPPDMQDADGNPVHALYGFGRFLADLLERARPEYAAVAFDASLMRSFRNRIYPPYKANREPAPPDLQWQFERCQELCAHLGVAAFVSDEYEADDIIGSLVHVARAAGLRATIVSRDKDLAQLVREGDVYWDYAAGERFHYRDIEGRFGVRPERYADYLALAGDAVDNIPGVPGVGPKTAAVLMRNFETLDDLYARLDVVRDLPLRGAAQLVERLGRHRADAFLARELTRIHCAMPLVDSHQAIRRRSPDHDAFGRFCDAHHFGSLLRRQAQRLDVT